jgi:hypothetical protein
MSAACNTWSAVCWMPHVDGVWIGNRVYCTLRHNSYLQVTMALSLIHTFCNLLQNVRSILSLYFHHLSPDNGFQRRSFPNFHVHVLISRRLWRLYRNHNCSSLYSFGRDRSENTYSNSSIVACVSRTLPTCHSTSFFTFCISRCVFLLYDKRP